MKELYDKIVCALTHNLDVCQKCGKCDRIDLIRILTEETSNTIPYEEKTGLHHIYIKGDFSNKIFNDVNHCFGINERDFFGYEENIGNIRQDLYACIRVIRSLYKKKKSVLRVQLEPGYDPDSKVLNKWKEIVQYAKDNKLIIEGEII